jgi:hypothetical protein
VDGAGEVRKTVVDDQIIGCGAVGVSLPKDEVVQYFWRTTWETRYLCDFA